MWRLIHFIDTTSLHFSSPNIIPRHRTETKPETIVDFLAVNGLQQTLAKTDESGVNDLYEDIDSLDYIACKNLTAKVNRAAATASTSCTQHRHDFRDH